MYKSDIIILNERKRPVILKMQKNQKICLYERVDRMPENEAPASPDISHDDNVGLEAAAYRLMSASDTCFARKNYNEAYTGYSSVLESDPQCIKAEYRLNISSQYLMCETAAVYLSSDNFFKSMNNMLTILLENGEDGKLILTFCRDMLDFILFNAEYEKRFALSHKKESQASAYMKNMLELMRHTLFIMNCIIRVNDRESAFAAMKCHDVGLEIYQRFCNGMEYYASAGTDEYPEKTHIRLREPSKDERSKADALIGDIGRIWQSILKNADDTLYGELKTRENKAEEADDTSSEQEKLNEEEYEGWRKRNEKQYISADSKSIIFGILSKTAAVFAFVFAILFVCETLIKDEVIGLLALSAVVSAVLWIVFSSLEKHLDNKRKFYARLVYGGAEQFQAEQKKRQ